MIYVALFCTAAAFFLLGFFVAAVKLEVAHGAHREKLQRRINELAVECSGLKTALEQHFFA